MNWGEPPDYNEVRATFLESSRLKARIRLLKLEIDIEEAKIRQSHPRNTAIRFLGTSDNLLQLRKELAQLENELDSCEAKLQFLNFHKELFRALSYTLKP